MVPRINIPCRKVHFLVIQAHFTTPLFCVPENKTVRIKNWFATLLENCSIWELKIIKTINILIKTLGISDNITKKFYLNTQITPTHHHHVTNTPLSPQTHPKQPPLSTEKSHDAHASRYPAQLNLITHFNRRIPRKRRYVSLFVRRSSAVPAFCGPKLRGGFLRAYGCVRGGWGVQGLFLSWGRKVCGLSKQEFEKDWCGTAC